MSMHKVVGFPRTITWSDFSQTKIAREKGFVALTSASFKQASREHEKTEYDQYICSKVTLKVLMSRTLSWVLKSAMSDDLLKHEQGHFDIFGLAVKQAADEIEMTSADTEVRLNHNIAKIYKSTQKTINEINEKYDEDTKHGTNKSKQKEWNTRFAKWKREGLFWYGS